MSTRDLLLKTSALAALACALGAAPAAAQTLRIGVSSEVTSIDPHFHNVGPNNYMRRHIFQALVSTDEAQKLKPELAASWRTRDDTTWEFKLRPNVKFSDGRAFTAKDVLYSFCRTMKIEGSPSGFDNFVRPITAIETPDELTLVVKTASPSPLLPTNLASVGIVAAPQGTGNITWNPAGCPEVPTTMKSTDFNNPANAVGTGPFKLVEYTRGQHVILTRNDAYWGDKPHWGEVRWRPLTNAGARVAALLSNDVDMIEVPPIQDHERIKAAGFNIVTGLSNRIIYVHLDQHNATSPFVKGTDKNPFKDKRVREALSKAINRPAIVERIMGGVAVPAGELLPHPMFGASESMKADRFDADAAKRLLTEAGFPNGFEVTLHTPNDRYINDEKITQAIAQMWTRIGVKTNVEAMTASTFFARRNRFEFSAYLAGWGADTGEMSNSLNALVLTMDNAKGLGHTNRGRYSNPRVDELTIRAMATIDNAAREKLLQEASKVAMEDYGILPLHFEVTPWAFKKGLSYKPRVDQYTLATEVVPAAAN